MREDRWQSGHSRPGAAALVSMLFGILASCGVGHPPAVTRALPREFEEPALGPPGPAVVHFYLDTTGSMSGFWYQPEGKTNYFVKLLSDIGGTLTTTWRQPEVHYWGFGNVEQQGKDGPQPIKIENYRRRQAFAGTRTLIDQAIAHSPPVSAGLQKSLPTVKIIVTDLYQDGNDMDKLAVPLSNILNDRTEGVGILGIRNPFDGGTEDLPGGQKLPPGAAESMPFYVLVIGPIEDVKRCIGALSGKLRPHQNEAFSLVFSRQPASRRQQKLELDGYQKANSKWKGFRLDERRVPNAADLGIPYLADVQTDLVLSIKAGCDAIGQATVPHVHVSSPPTVRMFRWQPTGKDPKERDGARKGDPNEQSGKGEPGGPDRTGNDPPDYWIANPARAVEVNRDLTIKPGGCMEGHLALDRSRLAKNAVYLVEIELVGESTDLDSLKDWNVEFNDGQKIVDDKEKKSFPQKLGKTPNLNHILETLSTAMFISGIPQTRYYFYVETR